MSNQTEYVLSQDCIDAIIREPKIKSRLALALKVTEDKITEFAYANNPHGKLLNPWAVNILQQELKIPPTQILVMVPAVIPPAYIPRGEVRSKKRNRSLIQ